MFEGIEDTTVVALIGLAGGLLLGLSARLGRFCTLGAIEDLFFQKSYVRMRMWCVAIGTAIIGTFTLVGLGTVEIADTIYLAFEWNPLASIFGGLLFGYGMALAGTCGFGALARLGGGDLRAFVIVLVMGISAYITLSGPLARLRVTVFPTPPQDAPVPAGYAHWIATKLGGPVFLAGIFLGAIILVAALKSDEFLTKPKSIAWGVIVGVAVVSGWAGTNWVAARSFDDISMVSHTFSAPLGDIIFYAMTSSGNNLNFGIGSVVGVVIGAVIGSLIKGHFRWEACEDPRELKRQILGAAIMGVGSVIAFGCTIGQGISAFSVLAYGAPVTLLSIVAGAWIGLRQLITGFTFLGFRSY